MTKNDFTVNGQIIGESSGGVRTNYLHDGLGSVVGTTNEAGVVQNTYRYKPSGSLLAKTGVADDPKFLWNGANGYRKASSSEPTYVRTRNYQAELASWLSSGQSTASNPYEYASSNPVTYSDPSGQRPPDDGFDIPKFDSSCGIIPQSDKEGARACLGLICKALTDPAKSELIKECLDKQGLLKSKTMECLSGWCSKDNKKKKIVCGPCKKDFPVRCFDEPCKPEGREIMLSACANATCIENEGEPEFNVGEIKICTNWYTHDCKGRLSHNCVVPGGSQLAQSLVHEALHFCSECFPQPPSTHQQRLDDAAKCILKVAGCGKKK